MARTQSSRCVRSCQSYWLECCLEFWNSRRVASATYNSNFLVCLLPFQYRCFDVCSTTRSPYCTLGFGPSRTVHNCPGRIQRVLRTWTSQVTQSCSICKGRCLCSVERRSLKVRSAIETGSSSSAPTCLRLLALTNCTCSQGVASQDL